MQINSSLPNTYSLDLCHILEIAPSFLCKFLDHLKLEQTVLMNFTFFSSYVYSISINLAKKKKCSICIVLIFRTIPETKRNNTFEEFQVFLECPFLVPTSNTENYLCRFFSYYCEEAPNDNQDALIRSNELVQNYVCRRK